MSGILPPGDFVEVARTLPVRPSILGGHPTEQDAGHALPKLQSTVGREEQSILSSEVSGDDDLDLEICFSEEMDAVQSITDSDSDSDDYAVRVFDGNSRGAKSPRINGLQDLDTTDHHNHAQDACSTLEWLQFINSTEGMLQYMDEATATILDASSLEAYPPNQDQTLSRNKTVEDTEKEQVLTTSSPQAMFPSSASGILSEVATPLQAFPPRLLRAGMSLTTLTESPSSQCSPEQHGPRMHRECLAPVTPSSGGCLTAVDRHPDTDVDAFAVEKCVVLGSGKDIVHAGLPLPRAGEIDKLLPASSTPTPRVRSPMGSPAIQAGPEQHPGLLFPAMVNESDTSPASVLAADLLTVTASQETVLGHRSPPNVALSPEGTKGFEPELPWDVRPIKAKHICAHQQESGFPVGLDQECAGKGGEMLVIADAVSRADVIASVGEAQVMWRIEREKARSMEARQKRREDNIDKARRTRSMVAFQAICRGCCTRTKFASALASIRRESEEKRRMFEEEQLVECAAAFEAERRELELGRQLKELNAMRCAEKRTRASWVFARHLEEAARGEELVRMRAEERFTRALLDLELQDLRRAEAVQRETREAHIMQSEDQATRKLKILERNRILEQAAMGAEDVLSRISKNIEEHELASSRAERCRMSVEDITSSAWHAEFHRQRKMCLRQARATSTPIQRAMDPRGAAAARALVCTESFRPRSKSEPLALIDAKHTLTIERARRRQHCKTHLDRIFASALQVRRQVAAPSKGLEKALPGYRSKSHVGDSQVKESLKEGKVGPREDRAGPAERDGAECELTLDMLSHLGPLQDLTALELCVEGLTSASLLQACTSLKSLSLNVNRLSSPAGLVVSTSLVRLGLRDNRLTSLQGLSGLPSLRELRLDINHLTSLHELKLLPALIELSANTNHIRELPEGFAAGLMSPKSPIPDRAKTASTLVERAIACGGLQKLELYHNRIASIHPRAWQGLASLTHLDLGRNKLKTLDGQGLEACPALSTLVLSQNLLREPPFPLCLPLLSELWLSGNRISSMGPWASPPTQKCPRPSPENWSEHCAILEGTLMEMSEDPTLGLKASLADEQATSSSSFESLSHEGQGRVRKSGQDWTSTSTYGQERRVDGDNNVWLPTLEVLHLQDNALESLGGYYSLAGCPLLRSIDASFNQLRTPGEIALSLQACSELGEVRLHDNPASTCPSYVDAIALGCPHLTRMDGVDVDTQVHWRAGANTYGRRADLVLPFLLNNDEVNETRHGVAATAPTLAPGKPTSSDVSESMPSYEGGGESCPWCGVSTLGAENANDTSSGAEVGGYCAGGGDGAGEEAGGVNPTSRSTKLPRHTRNGAGGGTTSGRRTCASCGFAFPDTGLWSVSESRAARSSVEWEDIRSAGERWHRGFRGTIAIGQETRVVGNSFREACLWGRDESASMKHRHRWEERNLAASADLNGVEPQSVKGEVYTSRSEPMAPSTRRLEVELELRERHAEERRHQAARQLLYHSGGAGHGHVNAHDSSCVVVDRRPLVAAEDRCTHSCFRPRTLDNSCVHQTSSAHRQSRAARVIQELWRQRQEWAGQQPVESPPRRGQQAGPWSANEKAVTKLQSAFRGYHVRRALQAALNSARYVDDELEGLLNADGGERFELDRFLSPPPELGDGWWGTAAPQGRKITPRHPTPPSRAKAPSNCLIDTARGVIGKTSLFRKPEGTEASSETVSGSYGIGGAGRADNIKFRYEPPRAVEKDRSNDRYPPALGRGGGLVSARDKGSGGGGGPRRKPGNDLARAWGLKDPRVARAIVKRAKRLRNFQNGEARREKLKDPDVRFDAFARKADERRTSSHYSRRNSGGEAATHRSGASGGGLGQESRTSRAARHRLAPIVGCDDAVATTEPGAQPSTKKGAPRNALSNSCSASARPWPPTKPHRSSPRGGRPRPPLCARDLDPFGAEASTPKGGP